ncbi:MAG TPA: hypothetical protein VFA65_02020, partial [Bryobacteraceae bacterium]|nr:hypothetical protein [Bryobacteraceae bacterium]
MSRINRLCTFFVLVNGVLTTAQQTSAPKNTIPKNITSPAKKIQGSNSSSSSSNTSSEEMMTMPMVAPLFMASPGVTSTLTMVSAINANTPVVIILRRPDGTELTRQN